jgi:hypothetical protein
MPEAVEETAILTQRKGDGAHARFTPMESTAEGMNGMPNVVKMDYGEDHAFIGMPDRYTTRILAVEFTALTPLWRILPIPVTHRDPHGYVVHETLVDWTPAQDFTDNDQILISYSKLS